MPILLLLAGLGLTLGLAFRVTVALIASAAAIVGLFVASYSGGSDVSRAALNALIGVAALLVGYVIGLLVRSLFTGLTQSDQKRRGDPLIEDGTGPALPDRLPEPYPARAIAPVAPEFRGVEDRVMELLREAPSFAFVLRGPQHVVEMVNEAGRDLVGHRSVLGRPIRDALPELAGQGFFELLDHVYAGNRTEKRLHVPLRFRSDSEERESPLAVALLCEPLRDGAGLPTGVFVDGHPVRTPATGDERLRELERLSQSTIDALSEHVAVLGADGTIARVNKAWRDFAALNRSSLPATNERANYLAFCDERAAVGDRDALTIAGLIRQVMSGEARQEQWEYEHDSANGLRWFLLKVHRLSDDRPTGVVLTQEDVTERKLDEKRIEYLATHDALTGLPNNNLLEDRTRQAIERSRRSGQRLALLSVDLDNFRQLNEAYGHAVGDATIANAALRIAEATRGVADTVARLGSDEFLVVVADVADPGTAAARVAGAIQDAIKAPMAILNDQVFTLSASVGISLYPSDGMSLDTLLKNAEAALYRAKALGRGGYQFYSPEMSARANERVIFEGELRRALARQQFELHYQPQVDIDTGALIGVEALVRWQHPELGWLQPARFIPIAEETGLIDPLGRYILHEACVQSRSWQQQGVPRVPVAVNIAAAQLRHADFLAMVRDTIAQTGVDPRTIELEITEGTMMEVTEPFLSRIDGLKQLGVRLSIDDFGTGYSNLAYLRTFPLDRLKIDQTFIASAPQDEGARSIVRAVLGLGESLGLEVVAEGVETADQASLLGSLGCRQAQGYFYGRPMPADELVAWVRARDGALPGEADAGHTLRR